MPKDAERAATLYRMDMEGHTCPSGLKSKALLEGRGFTVEDRRLTSRAETDKFKEAHGVKTTPQIWLGDERIGGYDDLRVHLGIDRADDDGTTYQPVIALFSVAALMAIAMSWVMMGTLMSVQTVEWFVATAMVLLGLQKLQDIESFSTMFLSYDLLARRWVFYGKVYPFAETGTGLLMLAGALTWLAAPVAFVIGAIGAVSVFKAVYIDRRELRCACVGGASTVPLGFISLTENLIMVGMALWMLSRAAAGA
ncbi:MAG: MauE/DoxX family redox-associated membrane protein [Pseudomonadota bacterium]